LEPADGDLERPLVLEVEPLADAEFRGEVADRLLGRAVATEKSEVEVAEVGASLGLLVTGGGFAFRRQVEEGVPVDPLAAEQFTGAAKPPCRDLFAGERRYPRLGHPHGFLELADPFELAGPVLDLPEVPVHGKAVDREHVHTI